MIVPFEIVTNGNAEQFSRVDSLENKAIEFNWRMSWTRTLKAQLQLLAFGWVQLQAVILRPGVDKVDSLLGLITSRCSGNEPALADTRERRKSSLTAF